MQYLSLTFQECMQTLFLRRWQEAKSKRTRALHFWKFADWYTKKGKKCLRDRLPTF